MASKYLLDTNIFIESKNKFYSFDIAPGFWEQLEEQIVVGNCNIIDAVDSELMSGNEDELVQWWKSVKGRHSGIVMRSKEDESVLNEFREIIKLVNKDSNFSRREIDRFFSGADPWISASAKVWNMKLVSFEALKGPGTRKVKIPDICNRIGVQCIDLYTMLREIGIQLH